MLRQLEDGASRLAGPLSARDITIEARELPDLVAYADPRLLARVFDNVLANAVHYNRDGGTVVISGSAEESAPDEWKTGVALITVTDTGPGIPPGESERVFDRFYRLDQSRARQTGGSGLGSRHLPRGVDRAGRIDSHHRLVHRRDDVRDQGAGAGRLRSPLFPGAGVQRHYEGGL